MTGRFRLKAEIFVDVVAFAYNLPSSNSVKFQVKTKSCIDVAPVNGKSGKFKYMEHLISKSSWVK